MDVLFEALPLPLWEVDLSTAKNWTNLQSNPEDLAEYLALHSQFAVEQFNLTKVSKMNQAARNLFGVPSTAHQIDIQNSLIAKGIADSFSEVLTAIADDLPEWRFTCIIDFPDGTKNHFTLNWMLPQREGASTQDSYSNVLVSATDITRQVQLEDTLKRSYETQKLLNSLHQINTEDQLITQILEDAINILVSVPFMQLSSKGGVFLVDSGALRLVAYKNLATVLLKMCDKVEFGQCLCGRAAESKTIQFADCVDDRHENTYKGITPHGHYNVPIMNDGDLLGVIVLYLQHGHRQKVHEVDFLETVANILAGFILKKKTEDEKNLLEQQLRPTIPATVEIKKELSNSCEKINADATQIHQVIVNLCTNAWQSMEETGGTITIRLKQKLVDSNMARLSPHLKEADYAVLSIGDTGSGINEAVIARIFEPYFTTKNSGTGLGLSVIHGIVRKAQGDIVVESKLNHGSTFHVYLPVSSSSRKLEDIQLVAKTDFLKMGHGEILIVDDEVAVGDMLKTMLSHIGFQTHYCTNGNDALNEFRKNPNKFSLVLTDFTMPSMTGLELASEIKKIKANCPVIIVTGYGLSLTSEILAEAGVSDVINKPLQMKDLVSSINRTMNPHSKLEAT